MVKKYGILGRLNSWLARGCEEAVRSSEFGSVIAPLLIAREVVVQRWGEEAEFEEWKKGRKETSSKLDSGTNGQARGFGDTGWKRAYQLTIATRIGFNGSLFERGIDRVEDTFYARGYGCIGSCSLFNLVAATLVPE